MTFQANHPQPLNGNDSHWMLQAIELAKQAKNLDEVPVGAVLVLNNEIIGRGFNQPINLNDPTAHAEVMALRDAANTINNYRLVDTTLYVTLQPCQMCLGAIRHARVKRLVFGASDTKEISNHFCETESGVLANSCSELLKSFFNSKREK